jgi:hypothetical protein
LITPPVEPQPNSIELGPRSTSTRSVLNVSRLYWPMSRTTVLEQVGGRGEAAQRDDVAAAAAFAGV